MRDGLAYPHGCQRGRCGSCKSRLHQGKTEMLAHSPFALEAPERHQGLVEEVAGVIDAARPQIHSQHLGADGGAPVSNLVHTNGVAL